ncbi:hypothetical protein BHE74_00055147 [Ensete ventricosum]|nr:hypothetical protein GW17_00057231 [Ensete ventricosum]RWW39516.1 hypothetical protein BHE74_00055147 [Ensete ventricosum]RZR76918.1 hypothetical protein BHM03_00001829 [Ensete ventricosum]
MSRATFRDAIVVATAVETMEHKDSGHAKPQLHQRSPSLRVEAADLTLASRVISEEDVAERRGGGDQSGTCSRKETPLASSPKEVCVREGAHLHHVLVLKMNQFDGDGTSLGNWESVGFRG